MTFDDSSILILDWRQRGFGLLRRGEIIEMVDS